MTPMPRLWQDERALFVTYLLLQVSVLALTPLFSLPHLLADLLDRPDPGPYAGGLALPLGLGLVALVHRLGRRLEARRARRSGAPGPWCWAGGAGGAVLAFALPLAGKTPDLTSGQTLLLVSGLTLPLLIAVTMLSALLRAVRTRHG